MNNESTLTHSSIIAKSKLSIKTSIFHKDAASLEPQSSAKTAFQCQHTSALSSPHMLKKEGLIEELSQSPVEKGAELSVHNFTNDSTYSIKYPAPFNNSAHSEIVHKEVGMNDIVSIPASDKNVYEDGISSVNRHLQCRKFTSIRKEKDAVSFMHLNRHVSEGTLDRTHRNFTELSNNKAKKTADTSDKCNVPPSSFAHTALTENCDRTVDTDINEGSLNKMKVRYEEFQEHKAEMTSVNQQVTHYKFFPSVVLSNCLNRPQKATKMSCKMKQPKKTSRLKLSKKIKGPVSKKLLNAGGEVDHLDDELHDAKSDLNLDPQHSMTRDNMDSSDAQGSDNLSEVELVKDSTYAPGNACSKSPPDVDRVPSCDIAVMMDDGAFQGNTCEMNSFECQFEEVNLDSDPSSALYGNKYTLRAKRKVNFESEDGEASLGANNSKMNLPQCVEANEYAGNPQKSRKRRKIANKLPPIIIKYIIINRFKGRKNMQVKLEKLDPSEDHVILTDEKLNLYNKMAPLKNFWPKVPDSPATKYPLNPVVPKKNNKKKTKPKTAKKKPGKVPKMEGKILNRPLPPRRKKKYSFLTPPMPSYTVETEDCNTDYKDVMSKLGFLTERSPSPIHMSPPRCWSPTDPEAEELKRSPVEETPLFQTFSLIAAKKEGEICTRKRQRKAQANKTRKKSPLSPSTVNKQGNKMNPLEVVKCSKRQKAKPRQKKSEKAPRKHTKIKGRGKITNIETVASGLLGQDQPGTQAEETTKLISDMKTSDFTLSGFSTGHVHSTQLPSSNNQEDLQESTQSSVNTIASVNSQNNNMVQNETVSSSFLPLKQSIESFKISKAKTAVPNVFQTKESSATQNKPSSISRPSQVIQNAQFTLKCTPFTQDEDPTEVQRRLLASVVKLRDSQSVPDAMLFEKLQSKLLPCTMNSQQQLTGNQDQSKKSDSNSSSESQLPRSSLVTSLRSPIKMATWEHKGELFDGTQFTPRKFNQNCLPDIFSCTKTPRNPKTIASQGILDAHCGIAVLKELLHKKQAKEKATAFEESSPKLKGRQSSSHTEPKCATKKSQCITPSKKPRAPRNTKPKAAKNLKTVPVKNQADRHSKTSTRDGTPAIFADPDFESCYSLEDSLSPEHNYNFDINSVGQTGLCSLYTGSQFIPADQNLPQKFLSDPFPASATENERIKQESKQPEHTHVRSASDQKVLLRPSSLTPDLFEKSSIDHKQNFLVNQPKNGLLAQSFYHPPSDGSVFTQHSENLESNKCRLASQEPFRNASFNAPQSEWIHIKNETKDSSVTGSSFTGLASSPEIDFMDGDLELYISRHSGGLTPTPDSSPRSMSSPSQSKNGNATPRPVHILKPLMSPPSREEIMATLLDHDLMETVYQEPFFSNPSDAPEKPR